MTITTPTTPASTQDTRVRLRPRLTADTAQVGVLVCIVLSVGLMAGAASFHHVKDWTLDNSPDGTADWFGWANAVISELIPTASIIEIGRRRRRNPDAPVGYPMVLLVGSVGFSLTAQLAVAKPGPSGWVVSALPALAFLGLSKLVFTATSTTRPTHPVTATAPATSRAPSTDITRPEVRPTAASITTRATTVENSTSAQKTPARTPARETTAPADPDSVPAAPGPVAATTPAAGSARFSAPLLANAPHHRRVPPSHPRARHQLQPTRGPAPRPHHRRRRHPHPPRHPPTHTRDHSAAQRQHRRSHGLMTSSTLPLAPTTTSPVVGAGANAETFWPWATPTARKEHPDGRLGFDPAEVATARRRVRSADYPDWLDHVAAAAACTRPIRLSGQIDVRNPDGSIMHTIDTDSMPDGVIYTPCGNRRAAVCPSCAEVYRRDTYQIIRAGLEGGRYGLPPLDQHIAVFLTATAPSFGPVHRRVVKAHAADCRTKHGCTCRAALCRPFGKPCPHGVAMRCTARHKTTDPALGTPLCLDCYDHAAQVVWNHEAPELWRRTIQEADRELGRLGRRLGVDLRRRYFKVNEFQARGVIHYHAVIRLDGYHPDCPDAVVPADRIVTRAMFDAVLRHAFTRTAYTSRPHPAHHGQGWRIGWGTQLDIAPINLPGGDINLALVAGYIAKYVTKSTEATGRIYRRIDDYTVELLATPDTHLGRLIGACWTLGAADGWHRLRRYAHQYGHGGYITTKSRDFSVTYTFKRDERTIWRRTQGFLNLWDDQQADLVVYRLGHHATGWITTGDALLANSAADAARRRADTARDYAGDDTALVLPRAA
jgi:hypothetical protein